ncbi:hypothetical protein [uncultured Draconibacterium sp.]|uniref:hypothetical protein n=1 Tax=uncultured Draconibacterium sp. TaxID=1573823 RepID=UPI0025F319F2|nr:hypothetical protein [uncultured Draconibacterium sp.]
MQIPEGVLLLDSLGDLIAGNTSPILVCGSHCGGNSNLAKHVKNCGVKAVFLNNAGIGKNEAGIRGLLYYEAESILACAVDNYSAEIGISHDTWESGTISHLTPQAEAVGIQKGDTVHEAVAKICHLAKISSPNPESLATESPKLKEENGSKNELKQQQQIQVDGVAVTVADSITFLNKSNYGDIVVCGSHGGLSAGEYAQKYKVKAVFFNDAGIGKNNAGIKSLLVLNSNGILACTVDCMSAEIFDGEDVLENGRISVCNELAKNRNIREKMTVKEAIKLL